jgi:hypothetical protein
MDVDDRDRPSDVRAKLGPWASDQPMNGAVVEALNLGAVRKYK